MGANLSGTTAVMFGSRPAASFTVKSDKKIIAYSPAGSVGRVVDQGVLPDRRERGSPVELLHLLRSSAVKKNHRR